MAKTKAILVATRQLRGGVKDKNDVIVRSTLEAGEELTAEKAKALGLIDADVKTLTESGALVEQDARVAESDGGVALAAAIARAEKAEGEVKALTAKVTDLEAQLAAAKKPA